MIWTLVKQQILRVFRVDPRPILLLLGLLHGLIYVFLMPPWQHYDEFNNFQYVWLIAHHPGLPGHTADDPQMDRWVLESMAAHGFYRGLGPPPDLSDPSKPVPLGGYTQLYDPPLYFWLAALPARLLPPDQVDAQLYAGRLVSLLLFLVTLLAAWGTIKELTPPQHPLRWMVPFSIALLPGMVDLMTSLNNDVGAVAFFSLFLWACTRLLKKGFSLWDFAWALAAALACFYTKVTVYIALPVLVIVLFFTLLRGALRKLAWGLIGLSIVASLAFSLTWGDAASWYRASLQPDSTRVVNSQAVLGTHVLRLDATVPASPHWLVPVYQHLPLADTTRLAGGPVTFGVWMWASRPVKVSMPVLHNGPLQFTRPVDVTLAPTFQAITATLPAGYGRLWVTIASGLPANAAPVTLYYDAFVLVEGSRPPGTLPQFAVSSGASGQWGGQPFFNFLRNPSLEQGSLYFRPWVDLLGHNVLPDNILPSTVLASLLDLSGTGWIYLNGALRMFRTFWGLFGWGNVPLLGYTPYRWLAVPTLLGIFGFGLAAIRWRRKIPWDFVFIFSLVLLVEVAMSLLRSSIYTAVYRVYLPAARYAQPAIIVAMLALNLGWLSLFSWKPVKSSLNFIYRFVKLGSPGVAQIGAVLLYLVLFAWLDFYAILSIWVYYH
jgi:Dolichyl-phosphate-mannose-protein mannosyltransferase